MIREQNNNVSISGKNDINQSIPINVTHDGHLEIAIHDPINPFGSIHAERLTPIFQADGVYGLNIGVSGVENIVEYLSGDAYGEDGLLIVKTGTTIYGYATIQSRKRLRYRSGQGSVMRFTAKFPVNAVNSYLIAGIGHSEDGFFIGYNGIEFGILYSHHGVREARTLTITTGSSTAQNITITLNGVAYTVAVTNSGNIQRTVWEICQGTYLGWSVQALGATVVFLAGSSGAKSGAYSVSGTTVVGSFAQTKAGVAATESWITQSNFNGDTLDGTGSSGFDINPVKLNVFQINIQYLGTGAIEFKIEVTYSNNNNPSFITFHTLNFPNTLTIPSVGNPSFPFTIAAYSAGSTTDLSVATASYAGFVEGDVVRHGNRFSYYNQLTNVGAASYHVLFTIFNSIHYKGRSNQSIINLLSMTGAVKHTNPVTIFVIRNGALVGNPNFSSYATNSCSLYDSSATTLTITSNEQIITTSQLGETGNFYLEFEDEITLQPGEWLSICARSVTGTPSHVIASLNTREDQ